jgi:thiamine biosynthesis protein ThiS
VIKISVNNQPQSLEVDRTLAQALIGWGYEDDAMFAVAVNREFIPNSEYEKHVLCNGDDVDIVQAISGG